MLGPVGAKPPSVWTPVRRDALSTLVIQVLSSFPLLLQLLLSCAIVEEQTESATDSVLLPTRQLSEEQNTLLCLQLPSTPPPQ